VGQDGFEHALERTAAGLEAMGRGDPAPYRACWAAIDDVTLFGAFGTIEHGYDDVMATLDWVASRFSDGALVPAYDLVHVGADTAHTVASSAASCASTAGLPARSPSA
jgi:hypothetical protein